MVYSVYSQTGNLDRAREIKAGLSTRIVIKVGGQVVGAIQSFNPSEDRPLTRIQEVSTDGVIEIVPTSATAINISVSRLVFDKKRLPEAYQRGFRHIHAQRLPFDIEVYDYNYAGVDGNATIVTTYKNCWLQSYNFTYSSDNYLITENATIWAEAVFDSNAPSGKDAIEAKLNQIPGEGSGVVLEQSQV